VRGELREHWYVGGTAVGGRGQQPCASGRRSSGRRGRPRARPPVRNEGGDLVMVVTPDSGRPSSTPLGGMLRSHANRPSAPRLPSLSARADRSKSIRRGRQSQTGWWLCDEGLHQYQAYDDHQSRATCLTAAPRRREPPNAPRRARMQHPQPERSSALRVVAEARPTLARVAGGPPGLPQQRGGCESRCSRQSR